MTENLLTLLSAMLFSMMLVAGGGIVLGVIYEYPRIAAGSAFLLLSMLFYMAESDTQRARRYKPHRDIEMRGWKK